MSQQLTQRSNAKAAASSRNSQRLTSTIQFSTEKFSQYKRQEQHKKQLTQEHFKNLVDKIIDKDNWKTRWSKIKTFVHNNQVAIK